MLNLKENKLLNDGFLYNQWVWFHGIGGGIFAWFLPVHVIFVIAVVWKIIELFLAQYKHGGVANIYGTKARFLRDSFGDITFALVIAEIVKLYPYVQHLLKG